MYEDLVKRLHRMLDWELMDYDANFKFADEAIAEAADAIVELSASVEGFKSTTNMVFEETEGRTVIKFEPKWIPVTERLPEEERQVLAYYGFNHGDGYLGMMFMQVLDYFGHDPRPHFQHEGLNGMTVTHWMPLPQPPKEEE